MALALRGWMLASAALGLVVPAPATLATDDEGAFRARQSELLNAKDPERIRIDRTPSTLARPEAVDLDSLGKPAPASVSISISELAAAHAGAMEPGILDFWIEGHYTPFEAGGFDARGGHLSVMYAGTTYKLGPDIMIGALAQLDTANEFGDAGVQSGSGWMAGPYASVRFGQGVILDWRAAWGSGELEGGDSSERRLIKGAIRGERAVAGWTVVPRLGLTYAEDTAVEGSSAGGEISSPAAGQGRLEVMPEVKRRFEMPSGTFIEPRASAGAFLSFDNFGQLGPTLEQATDLRLKAEAGVGLGLKDGVNVQALGGLEGSGHSAAEAWSGRFQLNMPLQ